MPAIAALVLGIVRLPELTRSPLWYDELFSVGVAGLPFADALRRIIADHTNPPLFYLLLKAWMAVGGESDQWVRLLPCLFSMMLGAALVWLAREARSGVIAGMLAVALATASPLSVDLANEVRAYSLLALLACLSLAATLRDHTLRTRDTFALMTLINVALVHTHYFGWLTIAAECVVGTVWWRADGRRVLQSAGFTGLAFVPWATAVATHALGNPAPLRNVSWITPPDAAAPLWLLRDLTGRSGNTAADLAWLAFVSVALIALAFASWRHGAQESASRNAAVSKVDTPTANANSSSPVQGSLALLVIAGLSVPLAVWAVSVLSGHSIWVQRYLLGAAAPVALLTAIAIAALPPRRWHVAAIVGLAWTAVACGALPRRAPTKVDWRRLARRIDVSVGSPREVFALEAFTAAPLQRYARPGMRVRIVPSLDSLPRGDAWLVYRPESFAAGSPADALRELGLTTVAALSMATLGQKIVAVRIKPAR